MTVEKAIKRLESIRGDAQAVLDTGFGNKPSESNTTYISNKEMADCKAKVDNMISHDYCEECGQAIDWSAING